MSHVFISYVRENSTAVDRLAQELQASGITVWLDRKALEPGVRWRHAIREAIENGSFFIACFSPELLAKDRSYMNEELALAIDELRRRPPDRRWFIPVCLTACQVPDRAIGDGETLRDIQRVDLYTDWDDGVRRIINVIRPFAREDNSNATAVMVTDICRSSHLRLRHGATYYSMLGRAVTTQADVILTFGGSVDMAMGDGVIAKFTSASKAVRCAIAVQQALPPSSVDSEAVDVRIGMHVGPGANVPDDMDISVAVAARICAVARPREVLASAQLLDQAAVPLHSTADRGEKLLKGFSRPFHLYSITSAT